MKPSKLSDIAKKTGLSITTVSRVINGKSEFYRISKKSQEIVQNAAKELGYKPNLFAQCLRKNYTKTIGLLLPSFENPFFASIAAAVIREAAKSGYTVMVLDTRESPDEEKRALETLKSRRVDGVVMVPCGYEAESLEELDREIPLVLIDRYFENSNLTCVCTDNFKGAYDATKKLIEAGHKDILCIRGVPRAITSVRRVDGYLSALSEAGLENNAMICGNDFSIENGYLQTQLAISSGKVFTAIFALSGTNLLGSIHALRDHNLKVPEDVSLISFDDNVYLNYLNPPISCVSQPLDLISIAAVDQLLIRLGITKHPDNESSSINLDKTNMIEIPPKIILRDSILMRKDPITL